MTFTLHRAERTVTAVCDQCGQAITGRDRDVARRQLVHVNSGACQRRRQLS